MHILTWFEVSTLDSSPVPTKLFIKYFIEHLYVPGIVIDAEDIVIIKKLVPAFLRYSVMALADPSVKWEQ